MTKNVQLALVDGSALTERDVMASVDGVIADLYKTGNLEKATRVVGVMDKINDVSGKAKAKLLWGISNWYKETDQAEKRNDTFEDHMETETGNRSVTIKRYVNVWKQIENCAIPVEIQNRPMDDLVKIATTLDNDYEITTENWKELQRAVNSAEVRNVLRKIKGQAPRKSSTRKVLNRDGSLNLYDSQDGKHYVGFLEVKSDDELVQKFIRQFVQNLGVEEK